MFNSQQQIKKITVSKERTEWIREIRRTIHRYPELGFKEEKTARYICEKLAELGIDHRRVGTTGVLATLVGPRGGNGHVLLRADMDALPIQEETGLPFSSVHPGVMHACGHDGHCSMLLGAAALLSNTDFGGRVDLLFQPAEESCGGATSMVDAGVLDGVDAVFCGHIDTHFETGEITVNEGVICAWADSFTIRLDGKGGHAARPHEAVDTIVASATLIQSLQTLISRETNPNHPEVLTIGRMRAGVAHNVISDEAVLEGTIRSVNHDTRQGIMAAVKRVADGVAALHNVKVDVAFGEGLPAVDNPPLATSVARKAAFSVIDPTKVISQGPSSLGGEDFSYYQQQVEGCMVRFGARIPENDSPAHCSTFDFDEDVLPIGAGWYASVALTWLDSFISKN